MTLAPVVLEPNPQQRTYRGGPQLAALRPGWPADTDAPEDWIASITPSFGAAPAGLTRMPDGRLLRDAVDADPVGWLGAKHVAGFGSDTRLLVKLLDAGERLAVHAHPDAGFARRELHSNHGKTEAWVVIGVHDSDPAVYLGFHEPVTAEQLTQWVEHQDVTSILGALHRVPVGVGDVVLVPAGTPHTLGSGVFVVEVQEPADLSIRLEQRSPQDREPLGLPVDIALQAVRRAALSKPDLAQLQTPATRGIGCSLLPQHADPYFRIDRPANTGLQAASYAVLICVAGAGALRTAKGDTELSRGRCVVVPHGAGGIEVVGSGLDVIRCRPPSAPGHARG